MQTEDYKLPPVKRQALIRKGLGHWLSIIDVLLQRFVGIEQIIERREEDGPMAVMMRIINDVCAVKDNQAAEAHLRFRLAHLPLFHYRAMRPGEPWEPLEETLEAFKHRGAAPSFWEDPNPYPDASDVESWLNRSISLVINNGIAD